jgi:hypothetical protein
MALSLAACWAIRSSRERVCFTLRRSGMVCPLFTVKDISETAIGRFSSEARFTLLTLVRRLPLSLPRHVHPLLEALAKPPCRHRASLAPPHPGRSALDAHTSQQRHHSSAYNRPATGWCQKESRRVRFGTAPAAGAAWFRTIDTARQCFITKKRPASVNRHPIEKPRTERPQFTRCDRSSCAISVSISYCFASPVRLLAMF